MTPALPPAPADLAARIISDTASRIDVPREALAARAAKALEDSVDRTPWDDDDVAARIVDAQWTDDELARVVTDALDQVQAAYIQHAFLITTVIDDLAKEGRASWIARALRHDIATAVVWEAHDRLGELTTFPDDALCATCGATLGTDPEATAEAR